MMRVGVVGINHKSPHLKLREELAKSCQRCFWSLASLHDDYRCSPIYVQTAHKALF